MNFAPETSYPVASVMGLTPYTSVAPEAESMDAARKSQSERSLSSTPEVDPRAVLPVVMKQAIAHSAPPTSSAREVSAPTVFSKKPSFLVWTSLAILVGFACGSGLTALILAGAIDLDQGMMPQIMRWTFGR